MRGALFLAVARQRASVGKGLGDIPCRMVTGGFLPSRSRQRGGGSHVLNIDREKKGGPSLAKPLARGVATAGPARPTRRRHSRWASYTFKVASLSLAPSHSTLHTVRGGVRGSLRTAWADRGDRRFLRDDMHSPRLASAVLSQIFQCSGEPATTSRFVSILPTVMVSDGAARRTRTRSPA